MPCYSGDDRYSLETTYAELNEVTALLCGACTLMDKHKISMPHDMRKWWKRHQEFDRQRQKDKDEDDRRETLRRVATSKLSAEEREVLGL